MSACVVKEWVYAVCGHAKSGDSNWIERIKVKELEFVDENTDDSVVKRWQKFELPFLLFKPR